MPTCAIPGCRTEAKNQFGMRLRKPGQRDAIWAPDVWVYVCDAHARSGFQCDINVTRIDAKEVRTNVKVEGGPTVSRSVTIDPAKLP